MIDQEHDDDLQELLLSGPNEPRIHTRFDNIFLQCRQYTTRLMQSILEFIQPLLLPPAYQRHLVSSDLITAAGQLRYHSLSSSFLLRGLPLYLIWWFALPNTLSFLLALPFLLIQGLIIFFMDWSVSATWPVVAITKMIWPVIFQHFLAFHTLYVSSAYPMSSDNHLLMQTIVAVYRHRQQ